MIDKTLEPAVRKVLASLTPGETLTTAALSIRLAEPDPPNAELGRALVKLADNVPGLCDRVVEIATKGYMKGKRVRRCIWHHIPSSDMHTEMAGVAHIVPGSLAATKRNQALAGQSFGAASQGISFKQELASLHAEMAQQREDITRAIAEIAAIRDRLDALCSIT